MAEVPSSEEPVGERRESPDVLRRRFAELVDFSVASSAPELEVVEEQAREGYKEQRVGYLSRDGGKIPAFLLLPDGDEPFPAVVAYHQHHSQWHLGKSEVVGLAGDSDQAFGPMLAREGVAVLAPDTVGFEDRRQVMSGVAHADDDGQRYSNEMASRLLKGKLLMSEILSDGAQAVSALGQVGGVDSDRIGVVGHSMGGTTALFHAALDDRVRFACVSGAAATYRAKLAAGTGIEASLLIPGIAKIGDIDEIAALVAPRPLLLVSATEDKYSEDADAIAEHARQAYAALGAETSLRHVRFAGGHALTAERVRLIDKWVREQVRLLRTS